MVKVLLTGFGPFLGFATNPSGEIAMRLNGKTIAGAEIVGKVLTVEHRESASEMHEYIVTEEPDIIIGTAIASQNGSISLENIALNRFLFTKDDEVIDETLFDGGKDVYLSTLPLSGIKSSLNASGIPAEYSFYGDTYISNEVFYETMRCAEKQKIKKAGFVHLPISHKQLIALKIHYAMKLVAPSMDDSTLENAVKIIIEEAVKLDD